MFKEYRKRIKMTQENLSELANIDIRNYQKIEALETIPLTNTFAKIVTALNLSDEEIINILHEYAKLENKKGKNNNY